MRKEYVNISTEKTDCYTKICQDDCLCLNCYKVHSAILNKIDAEEEGSDSKHRSMIEGWKQSLESKEFNCCCCVKALQHVANNLLQERAFLLPQVCHVFLHKYGVLHIGDIRSVNLNIDTKTCSLKFSSRWLLNQLILYRA